MDYVITEYLERLIQRALVYLDNGFPVHLEGPAGTGKTSLATHLAGRRGRPVMLIHGNEDMNSADIVGSVYGYQGHVLMDNFVHSVMKREETWERQWIDGLLTAACRDGMTLIYDEFTRSHPETNNVLLSVLEERTLQVPGARPGEKSLRVHPEFRAIFTSNPHEYAGVYKGQDALRDRMITIELGALDIETEVRIASARSGLEPEQTYRVVTITRLFAAAFPTFRTTLRRSIMIASIVKAAGMLLTSEAFADLCFDILGSELFREASKPLTQPALRQRVSEVIAQGLSYEEEVRKWVQSELHGERGQ